MQSEFHILTSEREVFHWGVISPHMGKAQLMTASWLLSLECKVLVQQHQWSHQCRHRPSLAAPPCSFPVCLPQAERAPRSLPRLPTLLLVHPHFSSKFSYLSLVTVPILCSHFPLPRYFPFPHAHHPSVNSILAPLGSKQGVWSPELLSLWGCTALPGCPLCPLTVNSRLFAFFE